MAPLVTIFIPTKNRLPLLRRAVHSILGQTVRNLELIVVSDGATDGTPEFVDSVRGDIPVRLIHNEQSRGACAARNQALEMASGEFVTGLDDDDFFMPHRIERFQQHWARLEQDGTRFSCLFDTCIVDDGRRVYVNNPSPIVDSAMLRRGNAIGNQVYTRRSDLIAAGMYDPQMPAWQDWETWVRLVDRGGPAINIRSNTYFMDVSHEFERITARSGDKIHQAARLFYQKHCSPADAGGVLLSMSGYPQVELTARDLLRLLLEAQLRPVARKLVRGKYTLSLNNSLTR
ncbi:glycosyltransferase involved in cell wall biosynthesis [Duganella sp. 1224]|uniref:glycosyltransferase n=1 Tax=Duganella sp. 1224 TaxID=2587052 RepID=UPI0015C9619B|nr:glycosyltransferase [Duganella sp. 1224]NYE62156.1 glycosyltransferase involved in cell wall biosynthesis [Duganella sp. 1224]